MKRLIGGPAPRSLAPVWRSLPCAVGLLGACLALGFAGCATGTGGQSEGIEAIHLFGLPTAVNMDSVPGPDGVVVRVYASGSKTVKGLPIRSGRIEILMFDGVLKEKDVPEPTPLRTWNYSTDQLKKQKTQNALGTGYIFALQWRDSRPAQRHITIIVRYVLRGGMIIQSAPSTISLSVK